jgi:hypothetical protein
MAKLSKKFGQIARAFISIAPDTEWYKHRNEICNSCEYNSLNIPEERLSVANKLVLKTVCDRVCTACGCCTQEKTKLTDSVCGLVEIGLEPKWGAVEAFSKAQGVSVEVLGNEKSLTGESGEFLMQFETTKDVENISLLFKGKELVSAIGSCSCMSTYITKNDEYAYQVDVTISTVAFSKEQETTRKLALNFMRPNGKSADILTITFKIKKS